MWTPLLARSTFYMTPFAIAGVQMYVNPLHSNVEGMLQRGNGADDDLLQFYPGFGLAPNV